MLRRAVLLSCCLFGCFLSVAGAADVLPPEELDRFVSPLTDGQWAQGVVVGLIRQKENGEGFETQIKGYGRLSADDARVPDGDTVFEIGSITKTFTGILLAQEIAGEKMKLDDPVQNYLPEDVKLVQAGEQPLTLLHLATHRSGWHSLPSNFKPKDGNNPYADYTVDQLYAFLREHKSSREPGKRYEYSNLGLGLLGHIIARQNEKTYEEIVRERILDPLGMKDTSITLSDDQKKRLAPPHDGDGNAMSNWDIPTFAGAGALRSTVNDMVKYAQGNLSPSEELTKAIALSHQKHGDVNDLIGIGLGWHMNTKLEVMFHNGQTGGYHSYVAVSPKKKFGVVVLSNTSTEQVDRIGDLLLVRMLGESAEPPKLARPIEVKEEALKRYIGIYEATPEFKFDVTQEGNQLFCQCTGQAKYRIYPKSEKEFFWKVVAAEVTFDVDDDGNATSLTLHQNGRDLPAKRVIANAQEEK